MRSKIHLFFDFTDYKCKRYITFRLWNFVPEENIDNPSICAEIEN